MSDTLYITATLTCYADNYGTFRYMLNNHRISKFFYEGLERRAINPCCFLTTTYRNRRATSAIVIRMLLPLVSLTQSQTLASSVPVSLSHSVHYIPVFGPQRGL
jgi:hypothetical protein